MPTALIFDVFGTVADWRGSIARGLAPWIAQVDDRLAFADAWRARYQPSMEMVRSGQRPFVPLDTLHRENLDAVIEATGATIPEADRDRVNLLWHRLDGWPDSAAGLARLGERFILAPHSNGNVRLMLDMARHNGWRWDAILGAETTGYYKPRPESYRGAAAILMLPPGDVMMVAAHNSDLAAARACGLATAFIPRPTEHGPGQTIDLEPSEDWDVVAEDLSDLAAKLGA
ncbi:haloacid dehalogenase type II [Acuticoccus sp. I52.16.1]|uniref:haloacid dehalogenase type II n=1 Tax=Acuticoccus sp. I52.16.1 TaxID=2928472 RepID=UPI001FD48FB4|nr:haloacid dehalogenase type II [Acuticoccus sp. I52.16.1]UOM34522.1 haloacid dehalogenase type II [Acuticoccus sp. I52.16.1]